MERESYLELYHHEEHNWWFVARRMIVKKIAGCFFPNREGINILEIGCGTGGNLELLSTYGKVYAMENDEEARKIASEREICSVRAGDLPDNIPFEEDFDLICMLDVLEHIDDDVKALQAIKRRIKQGGSLLITVPAYKWLWSDHDVILHHKRRYTKKQLYQIAQKTGYQITYSTYFNVLLFPMIALLIIFFKMTKKKYTADTSSPPNFLNEVLKNIFAFERVIIPYVSFPLGVSILFLLKNMD